MQDHRSGSIHRELRECAGKGLRFSRLRLGMVTWPAWPCNTDARWIGGQINVSNAPHA